MNTTSQDFETHSVIVGYLLWIFGFLGAHRFYYGKQFSGTIYFFTLGLLFIGWFVDLFLIPSLNAKADKRYKRGPLDYSIAWLLLTFTGLLGIHRMYLGKWISGFLYLITLGLFGLGYIYDLWTLNEQISEINGNSLS
jgi:TM2 domain-containing membrane protein YozV